MAAAVPSDRRPYSMARKFGLSFSWKRALGISGAKQRLARTTGIPLTRSGAERKLGRWILILLGLAKK